MFSSLGMAPLKAKRTPTWARLDTMEVAMTRPMMGRTSFMKHATVTSTAWGRAWSKGRLMTIMGTSVMVERVS